MPFVCILSQTPTGAALGSFRPDQHGPVNWHTLLLTEHLTIRWYWQASLMPAFRQPA